MTKPSGPILSVVIPAYNEESRILPTLEKIQDFLGKQVYEWEVIVVNDCSTDQTGVVVQQFIRNNSHFQLLENDRNIGKGGSIKNGMAKAKGALCLFSDADLSTPIEEINGFFKYIKVPEIEKEQGGYDVVIGSRRVRGARITVRQPVLREAAGRIFSVLVRVLTLRGFIDTQCGFKMFTKGAAQEIFSRQTIPGFGFDVEILFIAHRVKGYRIKEAPVQWTDSPFTRVNVFKDSARMFFDLILIRWNYFRGRYSIPSPASGRGLGKGPAG